MHGLPCNNMRKFNNKIVNKYRSKLEEHCAWALTEHGIAFEYEPIAFEIFPGFKYPNTSWEKVGKKFTDQRTVRKITYTPDFVGTNWIIETKGVRTESFNLKWKMFKQYLIEHDLHYDLYAPSNKKEIQLVINFILNPYA